MANFTWNNPTTMPLGEPLSSVQLNATANVAGVFIYIPGLGKILPEGVNALSATFYPADASSSITITSSITVLDTALVVNWGPIANIITGTKLSATQLNATANIPGSFSYEPSINTILPVGTTTLHCVFTPSAGYPLPVEIENTITVIDPLISLSINPTITSITQNQAQSLDVIGLYTSGSTLVLNNQVTFTSSSNTVTYVNGILKATIIGTVSITFTYESISFSFTINITPPSPGYVNNTLSSFYKSHQLQELLNYFDKNDVRVRNNPTTLDAQLLNVLAIGCDKVKLKLDRESKVNLTSPCNIDNSGIYYAYTNAQVNLSTITNVTGVVNTQQVVFNPLDEIVPIPYSVITTGSSYKLTNPVLLSFTGQALEPYGESLIQQASIGVLPWPEIITIDLYGDDILWPFVDIIITGYKFPKPLWIVDQELITEVVTISTVGSVQTLNTWQEITSVTVRGLDAGYYLNFYGHTFNKTYKYDPIKYYTDSTQRYSKFPIYWYNNTSTSEIQELTVENTAAGYNPIESYRSLVVIKDIAPEPYTYGLVTTDGTNLYYCDRRTPFPLNTTAMAITTDPMIGISVDRDYSVTTGTTVIVSPVLYPASSKVFQYRIYFQDPTGKKTVVTPDGNWFVFNNQNGWRTSNPAPVRISLPTTGSYVFTIQAQAEDGTITNDSYLYNDLPFNPLVELTLPITNVIGMSFDSNDNLWVWDGATATQLQLLYNGYIVDLTNNILYLTQNATGVTVS